MDEEESDEMYIHNVFNYSTNRIAFWKNNIINNLKLVNPNYFDKNNSKYKSKTFSVSESIYASIEVPSFN